MGKTKELFKKTGEIKGIFHARMGMIKDRSSKDLPEAEEVKKWWQDTQKGCTEKVFMTQITTMV